jgi:AcrR family transcriptional regulator
MSRPPDPRIRSRLREQAVDYVLANGLADLSLRPLARTLRTSARMLVYHFGSREELLREILESLRAREDARIEAWWRSGRKGKPRTLPDFLRWFWQRFSSPRAAPAVRLVFEVYAMALRDPKRFPGVLEDPIAHWERLARRSGLPPDSGAATATLLLASVRGLLLDLVATGDRARVGRAMKQLEALARSGRASS